MTSIPASRTNKRCAAPNSFEIHCPCRLLYSSRIEVGALVEPACACAIVIENPTITTTAIKHANALIRRLAEALRSWREFQLGFLLVGLYVLVSEDRSAGSSLADASFGRITPVSGLCGFDATAILPNFFCKIAMLSEPLLD